MRWRLLVLELPLSWRLVAPLPPALVERYYSTWS